MVARGWGEEEMRINCLMDTKYYFGVMNILWNRIEKVITQQCEFFTLKCLFYIMHFCLNKKKNQFTSNRKENQRGLVEYGGHKSPRTSSHGWNVFSPLFSFETSCALGSPHKTTSPSETENKFKACPPTPTSTLPFGS